MIHKRNQNNKDWKIMICCLVIITLIIDEKRKISVFGHSPRKMTEKQKENWKTGCFITRFFCVFFLFISFSRCLHLCFDFVVVFVVVVVVKSIWIWFADNGNQTEWWKSQTTVVTHQLWPNLNIGLGLWPPQYAKQTWELVASSHKTFAFLFLIGHHKINTVQ